MRTHLVEKSVENPETVPQMQVVEKTVQTPQLPLVVQAPLVQVMAKTVQIPQLPYIEKIAVIPEIRTVPGTRTSESANTESVHQVIQSLMKGLITDFTDMEQSVFDGINKLIHDIAGGVHVGKDDLDDGMFEHAEASMQQPHSSSKQPTQTAQEREREKGGQVEEREDKKVDEDGMSGERKDGEGEKEERQERVRGKEVQKIEKDGVVDQILEM